MEAAQAAGAFSLDVETTGKDVRNDHLICISFGVRDKTWFLPLHQLPNSVPLLVARDWLNSNLFNRQDLTLIGHNVKFDIHVLRNHGFVIQNKLVDTMLAEYVTNEYGAANRGAKEGIFGLKELVEKYFGIKRPSWEEVRDLVFLSPKEFEQYSRNDAQDAWRLWYEIEVQALKREGPKIEKLFYQMEMPLVQVILEMESSGLYIDIVEIERILKENAEKIKKLEEEIFKQAKRAFNIGSGEQLSEVLFHDLKIPPGEISTISKSKPEHPIYSTSKNFLKKLKKAHPIVSLVMDWRKAVKIQTGFLRPILDRAKSSEERRIYPQFKQTGTVIGRLSSVDPNSQNMPREGGVRDCIAAPPGKILVVGDLNQIEYRLLAHFSEDPVLINAYRTGGDMHKVTMDVVGCERSLAKCLTGDTLVFTDKGVRTIQSVIGNIEPDEHQPIPQVRLFDGRGSWVTSSWGLVRHERPCVYVVTRRSVVCCTADHRWLTTGGLVEAQHLKPGMKLPEGNVPSLVGSPQMVRLNPFTKIVGEGPCSMVLDEDWAYFAGIFHGDGFINGHTSGINHGSDEAYAEWRKVVREACYRVGLPSRMDAAGKNTYLGSRVIVRYLVQLGLAEYGLDGESVHRRMLVPDWVLAGGERIVLSYLAGLFDADGTVSQSGTLNFTTKCPEYAGQIALLLRALGCAVGVEPYWNTTCKRWYFRIHVYAASLRWLAEHLPLRSEKKEKLKQRAEKVRHPNRLKKEEVRLVIPAGLKTVYDFHVDSEDHLYLQGGLIGHNNVNFGLTYGMTIPSLAEFLDISEERAKTIYSKVYGAFKEVPKYKNRVRYDVMKNGFVETFFGRRRRFFGLEMNEFNYRQAFHFKIAGTAADVIKIGMNKLFQKLEARRKEDPRWKGVRMLAQIHDELVLESPEEVAEEVKNLVKSSMEDVGGGKLRVPIQANVGFGKTWSVAKK